MAWIVVVKREGDPLKKALIFRRKSLNAIGWHIRHIAKVRKTVEWTDEMDQEVRRCYYSQPASSIAKALSDKTKQAVSKNSVISRAKALGVMRRTTAATNTESKST